MNEILHLINEMSPYLLLGFFFAGLLHAFVPGVVYSRYLSGHNFRSVVYAAMLGVPLPLCSCGVIPTAMSLKKEGASKGATVAFLIATPETGVDSIAATYSLMGLPFAITRPIVAFLTSLFAGALVNRFDKTQPEATSLHENEHEEHSCCCHHEERHSNRFVEALRYGFIEMMGDIGKWLVVGLVVAGLITVFVPDSYFEIFKDNTALSMLLVLCIAIPMYICATGSIPIAVALIMKGLTPGAALVLLMAGPACNMASLLVINKVLGRKTLVLYLIAIITGAIVAGSIIDLLPKEWFMPTIMQSAHCAPEDTSWFNWTCTGILTMLLLYSLIRHLNGEGECHCHEHEASHQPITEEKEDGTEHSCCCNKD